MLSLLGQYREIVMTGADHIIQVFDLKLYSASGHYCEVSRDADNVMQ